MSQQLNAADPLTVGRMARIIFLALAMGVFGFAIVAAFLASRGVVPLNNDFAVDRQVFLMVWIVAALGAVAVAVHLWRRNVEPILHDRTADGPPAGTPERASRIATFLMISWSLVEGPALLALALFLVAGDWTLYGLGVVFAIVGFAATAPRTEWFRAERAGS